MGRYVGPRIKLLKRLGFLHGFNTRKKKNYKIKKIQSANLTIKKDLKNKKILKKKNLLNFSKSSYYIKTHLASLIHRQKIKFLYGLRLKQLKKYKDNIKKNNDYKNKSLFNLIESRLDCVLYRLGYFKSIPEARQAVTHKHIKINNKIVTFPSFLCKKNDKITIINPHALKKTCENNLKKSHKKLTWRENKFKKINLLKQYSNYKIRSNSIIEYNTLFTK